MSHSTANLLRALSGACLRRAIVVTVVVGTILNLINQWEAYFGTASVAWTQLLLTYCVPFCVATYGAFSAFQSETSQQSDI
jgi:hypothetical protein